MANSSGSAIARSAALSHTVARVPAPRRSARCARVAPQSPGRWRLEATWQTRCLGSLNQIRESGDERDSQWRVRQVYGDGKVLLDQLREVAELLAEGFNKSGSTSRDLLNGLVQKVRRRALSFPSLTLRLPLPLTSFRSIVNRCGGAAVTSCAS